MQSTTCSFPHFLSSTLALLLIIHTSIKKFSLEQGTCVKQRGEQGLSSLLPALLHAAPTLCLTLMPTQQVGQYVLTYFTCLSLPVALLQSVNKSNSAKAPRSCSHFAAPTTLSGESTPCISIVGFARLHRALVTSEG